MTIKKIGIIVKRSNPVAIKTSGEIALWLKERGRKVMVEKGCEVPIGSVGALPAHKLAKEADALVVLGGDGTMLHAARSL
ncbi:MAG: NAD(+)/NADH kinase [Deltaproteobacteria bacterium]|nr:NAD(+)/NADH kinase [Deltaproteobacteria bacterium]